MSTIKRRKREGLDNSHQGADWIEISKEKWIIIFFCFFPFSRFSKPPKIRLYDNPTKIDGVAWFDLTAALHRINEMALWLWLLLSLSPQGLSSWAWAGPGLGHGGCRLQSAGVDLSSPVTSQHAADNITPPLLTSFLPVREKGEEQKDGHTFSKEELFRY